MFLRMSDGKTARLQILPAPAPDLLTLAAIHRRAGRKAMARVTLARAKVERLRRKT